MNLEDLQSKEFLDNDITQCKLHQLRGLSTNFHSEFIYI